MRFTILKPGSLIYETIKLQTRNNVDKVETWNRINFPVVVIPGIALGRAKTGCFIKIDQCLLFLKLFVKRIEQKSSQFCKGMCQTICPLLRHSDPLLGIANWNMIVEFALTGTLRPPPSTYYTVDYDSFYIYAVGI